jgi:hypothetical protein
MEWELPRREVISKRERERERERGGERERKRGEREIERERGGRERGGERERERKRERTRGNLWKRKEKVDYTFLYRLLTMYEVEYVSQPIRMCKLCLRAVNNIFHHTCLFLQ